MEFYRVGDGRIVMVKIALVIAILLLSVHPVWTQSALTYAGADTTRNTRVPLEKKTVHDLQLVLAAYQEIYSRFVAKESDGMAVSADKLADAAKACMDREPEAAVVRVMQHIIQGAEELMNAEDAHETLEGFASASNALYSLFKSRPNQLETLETKLYWCKKDGYYWFQPQKQPPVCPYSASTACSSIEEVNCYQK
ncbi:MAG: hypothetical protein HZB37_05330 [Planctomycetes bacterium]|nr:hypothetical protein [Planctomycetota bacterium]